MLSGDFTIGLMTIITGLAIADMVASTHGLLMNRSRVSWDWLALLAATFIFLLIVSTWGISYRTMGNQNINPPLWLFVLPALHLNLLLAVLLALGRYSAPVMPALLVAAAFGADTLLARRELAWASSRPAPHHPQLERTAVQPSAPAARESQTLPLATGR